MVHYYTLATELEEPAYDIFTGKYDWILISQRRYMDPSQPSGIEGSYGTYADTMAFPLQCGTDLEELQNALTRHGSEVSSLFICIERNGCSGVFVMYYLWSYTIRTVTSLFRTRANAVMAEIDDCSIELITDIPFPKDETVFRIPKPNEFLPDKIEDPQPVTANLERKKKNCSIQ